MTHYRRPSSLPDWCGYLVGLKEVLEEVLFQIDADDKEGVAPDVSCLDAYDVLNTYMETVKRELGV